MNWIILLMFSFYSCNEVQESSTKQNQVKEAVEVTPSKDTIISQVETIEQIKDESNKIDSNLKSYKQVDTTVFGYSAEGSVLIGYYDNDGSLKKIFAEHFGETGKAIIEYYFYNELLILVHSKKNIYDNPVSELESIRDAAFIEDYYYFNKDVLIKWTSQYEKLKEASTLGLIQDDIRQTDQNNDVIKEEGNYVNQAKKLIKYAVEYKNKLSKK